MNKQEFLNKLYDNLKDIPEIEKREIMRDYEEHFHIGKERGLNEEEISRKLGDPEQIGKQYKYNSLVIRAEKSNNPLNILKVLICGMGLGFFNLVLGLPLLITAIALLISGALVCISMGIAGVAISVGTLLEPLNLPFISMFYIPNITSRFMILFLGIGITCISVAFTIIFWKIVQYFSKGILKYVKANVKIITG
ncbi:protein of unknown function DUF1700 [Gottschalkia purinilytica]|uniref:DUF1700 domain-containing protein n=1 Tax=Gottschalkia purinilytica TaxID=1503 RepID=A0A0L0W6R5_GOTPU|nr:DUF1700 domain-containing protein [Gottschalkia purinilytica]KNF07219.1 protein of unknown function DUF1700 [Gottschalkia purinilytica]